MSARSLTENQVTAARHLWDLGHTLAEIARLVGCSVYDLSPWLYAEAGR